MDTNVFSRGCKVWFYSEEQPYTVRCCDDRFVILTKPYKEQNTVLYTILDMYCGIRGTDDNQICPGYETDEECFNVLNKLQTGEFNISSRNRIILDIEKYEII